ncbi:hypothetical protein OEZ75_27775, partial [Leclercia adecarboxylata]|nr:hypothetical protein [Leclercia adecarboxylata]
MWPAVSLALIKANYFVLGASGFQKRTDGRLTPAARWLYVPYLAAAGINSRLWTRKHPEPDLIGANIWLGRIPWLLYTSDPVDEQHASILLVLLLIST